MTIVTLTASGRATPEQAWERYAVPALWPSWAPQIMKVEASGERLAPGLTGRVFGPLGVHVNFVVDTVDDGARRWSWTVRRGPLTLHLEHAVHDGANGSRTSLRIDGPLPVVLAYAPLAQLALRRLVAH